MVFFPHTHWIGFLVQIRVIVPIVRRVGQAEYIPDPTQIPLSRCCEFLCLSLSVCCLTLLTKANALAALSPCLAARTLNHGKQER